MPENKMDKQQLIAYKKWAIKMLKIVKKYDDIVWFTNTVRCCDYFLAKLNGKK